MSGSEPVRLTPQNVRETFNQFFPSIEVTTGKRIGGWVIKATVWRFRFLVSLTTNKIAATDQPGVATFTAGYLGPDGKLLNQTQATADSVAELEDLIKAHHDEMWGIVAAIEMACAEPPELRPPSIFDDEP